MDKRTVTIRDVARRVGVSVSTVSRVLNGTSYVSPETRRLVLEAIQDLEFAPSQIARGFATKKTATIGLIIPDVTNPFFSDVARGTEDVAIEEGFATILCNSDWKSEREFMYLDLLRGRWVDGVIVVGSRSEPAALAAAIGRTPYVLVERLHTQTAYTVWTDNRRGGALATQHLLDSGCRTFVHVSGPPDSPSSTERRLGFMDVMRRAGIATYQIIEGDYRYQSGVEIGQQIFSGQTIPEGIFAANDMMAIGILHAATLAGVRVPDDTAVIGYDNITPAEYAAPPLSTIDQPAYEMGRAAMSLLLERTQAGRQDGTGDHLDTPMDPQREFQPRLIVRRSTLRT